MAEKFDPRFDPAFQPGFEPSRHGASSDEGDAVTDDAEVEKNPFDRTLWIVAAVLVIGGIAVTFWSNSINYYASGSEWTWQQVLQQSSWALSTPMITVGLATGVALLFRRAAHWRPEE